MVMSRTRDRVILEWAVEARRRWNILCGCIKTHGIEGDSLRVYVGRGPLTVVANCPSCLGTGEAQSEPDQWDGLEGRGSSIRA